MEIYTDGACEGNQFEKNVGGWAVILVNPASNKIEKQYSGCARDTTNNRMELTAMRKAVEAWEALLPEKAPIFTDSAYIANCWRDKWYVKWEKNGWKASGGKPVKNPDLWKPIVRAWQKFPEMQIHHVKGHSTNRWNNAVDALAVAAIQACR